MQSFEFTNQFNDVNFNLISENKDEILYFDLETTGLSPLSSDLYIIGCTAAYGNSMKTTLLFNDDGCSEEAMLLTFNQMLLGKKILVSYNGDNFDIAYLLQKYNQFEVDSSLFLQMESMDIFKALRRYKKYLHMDSMRQVDMEELVGIKRNEFISGKALIHEYKTYIKGGNRNLLEHLINHNHDDLYGLVSITNTLSLKALFDGNFDVVNAELSDNGYLILNISCTPLPMRLNYGTSYAMINGYGSQVRLMIPASYGSMKYYFKDYKNYFYLPAEDTAIHKSVAQYVDSEYKIKATRSSAYQKRTGMFSKQPPKPIGDIYKTDITEKESYIFIDDNLLNNKEWLKEYAVSMINS